MAGGRDEGPLSGAGGIGFTGLVFVGGEVQLDVGFDAARSRLAALVDGEALLTASQDAYGEGAARLARVGPLGPVPGASRLVAVKFGGPLADGEPVVVALRWEAIGPGGGLFPALDANLTLARAGAAAASLRLEGTYRPPLGALGAGLDRVILHRVADATVQGFLGRIGAAIAHPARVAGPASGDGH
jgi:hypothetical protein